MGLKSEFHSPDGALWANAETTITCLLSDCLSHYGVRAHSLSAVADQLVTLSCVTLMAEYCDMLNYIVDYGCFRCNEMTKSLMMRRMLSRRTSDVSVEM